MSNTESTKRLARVRNWLMPDATESDRYTKALEWEKEFEPSDDDGDLDPMFEKVHEYAMAQYEELVDIHFKQRDQAMGLMRFNAYLAAGSVAMVKLSGQTDLSWPISIAIACWLVAIILAIVAGRRFSRPGRVNVGEIQDFVNQGRQHMYAWLNIQTNKAIVLMYVTINNEARMTNASLAFTALGVATLIAVVLAS